MSDTALAPDSPPASTDPAGAPDLVPARGWLGRTLWLIAGVTALRLIYLYLFCPYDLVEDEATYWEWSRRLDLSYYTKGPGIALAIRAATAVLGESEAAIRTVSAVASAVAAIAIGALGATASSLGVGTPRWRVGFLAAALFFLMPIFQAVGLLATIDGPYVACWAVAAWAAFLAIERKIPWAWPVLGLALGIGFLFKYTILLLLPGVVIYAIARRARFRDPGALGAFTIGAVLLIACMMPVLLWNQRHGWPTIAHLLGHLGVAGGDMPAARSPTAPVSHYSPRWTLEFIGVQLGIVGPSLVLAIVVALQAIRSRRVAPREWPGRLFLILCAAPILIFYLAVSFFTEPEGNWAMGAYVTLAALAAWGVADAIPRFHAALARWNALPSPRPRLGFFRARPELVEVVLWHWSIAYGVVAAIGMARIDLLARAFPSISGRIASVISADVLAHDAAARAAHLRTETGLEPFYIAQHYGRAGILAYYIPSHPAVMCSSSRMAGRRTNYDYWEDTNLDDPALLGRPALLVGAVLEQWTPLFDRVVPTERLKGEHKKDRLVFLGYGYKGWPKMSEPPHAPATSDSAPSTPSASSPE